MSNRCLIEMCVCVCVYVRALTVEPQSFVCQMMLFYFEELSEQNQIYKNFILDFLVFLFCLNLINKDFLQIFSFKICLYCSGLDWSWIYNKGRSLIIVCCWWY